MKQEYITTADAVDVKYIPGTKPGKFILQFGEDFHFKINDILTGPNAIKVKITKVYKYNTWRKILNFFGIRFKLFNCVKVKEC